MKFNSGREVCFAGQCYIIAEAGSNHDGDINRAREIISRAAVAGADAVKFQLFDADKIAANIDIPETRLNDQFFAYGSTVYDLYKGMELPESWLSELKACCDDHGVDFLATPFDEESADKLARLGVPAMKIASFEITHIPLLKHIGRLSLPVILSTGMATLDEIKTAIDAIMSTGEKRISLLHCGIEYPAPFNAVHLKCMETLRAKFNCSVGYSDHTEGFVVPIAAAAMGATILEKHVTLESGKSPDHSFALKMEEFALMVKMVRQCEQAMGDGIKGPQACEMKHLKRGRRSIFVVKDVNSGELFTTDNLRVLRPGIGLHPGLYDEIIGKRASRDIRAMTVLCDGDWL